MAEVTRILNAIKGGDVHASDELLPLVYEELRMLAAQRLSHEQPGQILEATALVHEAYLRLIGSTSTDWNSRGHFFAAAAEAMRRILIENARSRKNKKHGGGLHRVKLDAVNIVSEKDIDEFLALDEALEKLSEDDPQKANLVKMRYFAGLTLEQAAQALGISRATASRYWSFAQAWLYHEVNGSAE